MKPQITLKTRKPIDKLRPPDFDAFPIWEYAEDEESRVDQDETWVRPVRRKAYPAGAYSMHVAVDFLFGSGRSSRGFVTVNTAEGGVDISSGGVLLVPKGYFPIPTIPPSVARQKKIDWALSGFDRIAKQFTVSHDDIEQLLVRFRVPFCQEKRGRVGYLYKTL